MADDNGYVPRCIHGVPDRESGLRERLVQASIYLANGESIRAHMEIEAAIADERARLAHADPAGDTIEETP